LDEWEPRHCGTDCINRDVNSMAVKATATTRAPNGTKTLVQAFFAAADDIPEPRRDAVVKAALAAIRDQIKDAREQQKVAKANARAKAGKAAAGRRPKVASPAPKKQAAAAARGKTARAKPGRPRASPKPAPQATSET
jgi:hypothetical protein